MYQNLWDEAKVVLKGKLIANTTYKKQEKSQINNLTLCLKELGREEQINRIRNLSTTWKK